MISHPWKYTSSHWDRDQWWISINRSWKEMKGSVADVMLDEERKSVDKWCPSKGWNWASSCCQNATKYSPVRVKNPCESYGCEWIFRANKFDVFTLNEGYKSFCLFHFLRLSFLFFLFPTFCLFYFLRLSFLFPYLPHFCLFYFLRTFRDQLPKIPRFLAWCECRKKLTIKPSQGALCRT